MGTCRRKGRITNYDGEPSILALKEAVMKYHGGKMIPEMPAK